MNLCPKAFGCDMTDEGNLAYCKSMQAVERCVKCEFYVVVDTVKQSAVKKELPDINPREQWRLFQ